MQTIKRANGFTLVELMVTVGIVAVLSAIAIPAYDGYITTSATNAAKANAKSLGGFEDTYFYDHDTYLAGTYTPPGTDAASVALSTGLSWKPTGDDDKYSYVVTTTASSATSPASYSVTVTYLPNSTITATYP